MESIKLSSIVSEIGDAAFVKCGLLKDVVLKDGLWTITRSALDECSPVENLKFPCISRVEAISSDNSGQTKIVGNIHQIPGIAMGEVKF